MPFSPTIPEEELKLKVARDIFGALDCTRILGAVDFCVSVRAQPGSGLFNAETQRRGEGSGAADSAPLRLCVNNSGAVAPTVNHWIPFPESEVDAKDRYRSHFMVEFLRRALGIINAETQSCGESSGSARNTPPCPSGASPLPEGGGAKRRGEYAVQRPDLCASAPLR